MHSALVSFNDRVLYGGPEASEADAGDNHYLVKSKYMEGCGSAGGVDDDGLMMRKVHIADPAGMPKFWCESWKHSTDTDLRGRMTEHRTPAAHNVLDDLQVHGSQHDFL